MENSWRKSINEVDWCWKSIIPNGRGTWERSVKTTFNYMMVFTRDYTILFRGRLMLKKKSSQKVNDTNAWERSVRPLFTIWWCLRSTIPFCSKVYGQVTLWRIPWLFRKEVKERYSPLPPNQFATSWSWCLEDLQPEFWVR